MKKTKTLKPCNQRFMQWNQNSVITEAVKVTVNPYRYGHGQKTIRATRAVQTSPMRTQFDHVEAPAGQQFH